MTGGGLLTELVSLKVLVLSLKAISVRAPLAIAGGPATWKLGTNVKAQQKLNKKGLGKNIYLL